MLVDIHIMKEDGTPGRLHDTIDITLEVPHPSYNGLLYADYNGRKYTLLSGIRAMIVVPRDELK